MLAARLSASYWLVQLLDASSGVPGLTKAMRADLDLQVTVGASRAELKDQFGVLVPVYALAVVLAAFGVWGLTALGVMAGASAAALALVVVPGLAAVWYGVRWVTCPADDRIVVWRPQISDAAILTVGIAIAIVNPFALWD
jgi:hypothetical protein